MKYINLIINFLKKLFRKIAESSNELPSKNESVISTDTKSPDYALLWESCQTDKEKTEQLKNICSQIRAHANQYKYVEKLTGVPWKFLAAIHYRESSLNFNGCLHNGEPWNQITTKVPKGRGPFNSWEESAVDAIQLEGLNKIQLSTVPLMLAAAEKFNGLGYRKTGELSPYVWAGTNHHDETGKYVGDGKYSATAIEKQLGVAAILKYLSLTEETALPNENPLQSIYRIAEKELGQKEVIGTKHNPRIVEYHQMTTLKATEDEVPWCASFVCWCLEKAGFKSTKSAAAKSYLDWGKRCPTPMPGCVVVLSRGQNLYHVGFFSHQSDDGQTIYILGGNQNNSVNISAYPIEKIIAYRAPQSISSGVAA